MKECMERKTGIPQWYVIVDGQRNTIAGAGVIENDFHDRKDLTPNLCALFIEERKRGRGIAGVVPDFVRKDLASLGYPVTAQDSCDMWDRLLRYFATCGQEKPLSGSLKIG